MEKKKKRTPERKLTRTTIIALVVIVLATITHFATLWITPNRPAYYFGDIIYPIMKHWLRVHVAIFMIIIGAYAVFAKKFSEYNSCRWFSFIIMITCITTIIFAFSATHLSSIAQIDSARYNHNVYYLVSDYDRPSLLYIVYECDSWGIVCHQTKLSQDSYTDNYETISNFRLRDDKSELYVIIGEEEFLVATQSP